MAPESGPTKTAIAHLLDIFKNQATSAETKVDAQRVLWDKAQDQRVATEASKNNDDGIWINLDNSRLADGNIGTSSPFIVDYPTTAAEQSN